MSDRCILGVYAHPDDETTASAALMKMYAARGVDIHVITATRGEQGGLGTGGRVLTREELPAVREREQRAVLQHQGVSNPPIYLGYRDQEVADADFGEAVGQVFEIMERVRPDVVVIFGPTGLSKHPDHIAMHHIGLESFARYRKASGTDARLFYWAIDRQMAEDNELDIDGPEVEPNIVIDATDHWPAKVQALRMYGSQADAQWLADYLEGFPVKCETFYQVDPLLPPGARLTGFWEN